MRNFIGISFITSTGNAPDIAYPFLFVIPVSIGGNSAQKLEGESFFWSPESRFIVFQSGSKLTKIDVSGAPGKPCVMFSGPRQGWMSAHEAESFWLAASDLQSSSELPNASVGCWSDDGQTRS